jgi:sulfite reductase (ferredoxin)
MQSFRTELELIQHGTKALVEKDIVDLEKKIREFRAGKIPDEKFRSLRLARGVYGQRQQGVQMIRIKIPFGKISTEQLLKIADISDEYANSNLHFTTRQDVQLHYVSLDKTPEVWAKLEQSEITLREACGNTVRNITASAEAGIDPKELFDVSPYAQAAYEYFLRKPFGQELGRKIKIAFSNHESDTAYTFIHDIGFIPKNENGERGFKVLIGGGLGAQPFLASTAFEFLPADQIIPFIEAALRVFDRHGERSSRHKARLKYLVNKLGKDEFLNLVALEQKALLNQRFVITYPELQEQTDLVSKSKLEDAILWQDAQYRAWIATNVFEQKQKGLYAAYVKIQLGNILTDKIRSFVSEISAFIDTNDIRITINQGLLLKQIALENLPLLYEKLKELDLASPGFNSPAYITACPGTDTCNLAISNSTGVSKVLEELILSEYQDLIYNTQLKIKISGCMNSCGQHGLAQIGFHGSSFKIGANVIPALQVLLGGGIVGNGEGRIADKVIKVASKRAPDVLRKLLDDFKSHAFEDESFNQYYDRKGKDYFYQLLKIFTDHSNLSAAEFIDWGQAEKFSTSIGVGECAGVVIDLVQILFLEAEEKLVWSAEALSNEQFGDSIYFSYATFISAAKALLLDAQIHVNTHHGLINDFDEHLVANNNIKLPSTFKDLVLQINQNEPSQAFANRYLEEANRFLTTVRNYRNDKIDFNTK